VILGKNGWLFYTPRPVAPGQPLERPFEAQDLARWQDIVQARHDWLAARNIPYLLVIAPDKQTIYPEMLPAGLARRPAVSRLDQLLQHLRANTDIAVLDLRGRLLDAKKEDRLYARTDSHWNDRGAFVAYRQIVQAVALWFAEMKPLPRSAFVPVAQDIPGGDLASMLMLSDRMHEEKLSLQPRLPGRAQRIVENVVMEEKYRLRHIKPMVLAGGNPSGPRALVFLDSFGDMLIPYLSEHFARVVYAPADVLDTALVEREKPDVVIQEMVERKLRDMVPRNAGVLQRRSPLR
jgi:hypothetical protein